MQKAIYLFSTKAKGSASPGGSRLRTLTTSHLPSTHDAHPVFKLTCILKAAHYMKSQPSSPTMYLHCF